MQRLFTAFTVTLLFYGLFFVSTVSASSEISGVISTDTVWTKAGSPYTITGKALVSNGVTLTIESGVTINMNENQENPLYLQVNGTLIARGTESEKIIFNGGQIKFTQASTSYNEQTGSGCIIENAKITSGIQRALYIQGCSPKIINNELNCQISLELSSSIIDNNKITGLIEAGGGNAIISRNNITTAWGFSLYDPVPDDGTTLLIIGNTISNCDRGIFFYPSEYAQDPSCIVIQNNLITNNRVGIVNEGMTSTTICNNTIMNNQEKGISILDYEGSNNIIMFNNFQNNGYNLFLVQRGAVKGIDAAYNWWGTTDIAAINQTIYDFKKDFDLGMVNFVPFLTEPNPYAAGVQDLPIVTPLPTPTVSTPQNTPTPTPDLTSFNIESNSTISAFYLDNEIPQISFYVNGPDGTTGYVKITIAKSFMPNADTIQVLLDGNQVNRDITSNDDTWLVTFTYHHSSHQVTINTINVNTTENPIETGVPDWIWNTATFTIALGVAASVCIILWLAKKNNQTQTPT